MPVRGNTNGALFSSLTIAMICQGYFDMEVDYKENIPNMNLLYCDDPAISHITYATIICCFWWKGEEIKYLFIFYNIDLHINYFFSYILFNYNFPFYSLEIAKEAYGRLHKYPMYANWSKAAFISALATECKSEKVKKFTINKLTIKKSININKKNRID